MVHHYLFRAGFLCAALLLTVALSSGCGAHSVYEEPAEDVPPDADPVVTVDPVDSHPDGWQDPAAHGDWVIENGVESCYSCHQRESDVYEEEPTCASCHTLYPHEDEWGDGINHGVYVNENGTESCATQCHGEDLEGGVSGISCNSCHTGFPHQAGWEQASQHGTYVVANGLADCANGCHGTDFSGGSSGVSCTSCHADYPHTDVNWTASGSASVHAGTFIQLIADGDATACQECHGANYDRDFDGTSCLTCHLDGVTHMSGWSPGAGHGTYYSTNYDSVSTAANCKACHGNPLAVTFTDAQAKVDLAGQSDCYGCHWSYPHTGYYVPAPTDSLELWAPTEPTANYAHVIYLSRSNLFTDSCDNQPAHSNDPLLVGSTPACPTGTGALENTCGGSENGLCHFNGHRSNPAGWTSLMCAGSCHQTP